MNLNLRVSGPAGLGINSTSEMFGKIFSSLGYNVLTDLEYESRIKGGVNWYDINISDSTPKISKFVDIFVVFSAESITKSIDFLKQDSSIFLNTKILEKLDEETKNILNEKNIKIFNITIDDKYDNTYLLSLVCYYLNIDFKYLDEAIKEIFFQKSEIVYEANKKIAENIFNTSSIEKSEIKIEKIGEEKLFSYGNKRVVDGAIEGDLEYYSAYPMTPASSLLTEVIKDGTVKCLQAEDEVAVINSALGASFTGLRSMAGTSGGGFALMTEALSFAIQAEFPITVALSMRAGPSTGTPTFFEQGDFNFALNPTFGDFEHVVLYPSSLEECYEFGTLALNIADKFQTVVILLLDKQLSELFATYENISLPKIERGIILENPTSDYKRYEINESGISPRVKVGTPNGDFISTSYEHDEYGATSEDPEVKKSMTEKRWRKLSNFYKDINHSGFEVINKNAKKMLITTSANSYNLKAFVENNPEYGLIILKIIKPLNPELLEVIDNLEELIFVESNYSGQLENYVCKEFGLKYKKDLKVSNYRKYDLYPFYYEDLEERFSK